MAEAHLPGLLVRSTSENGEHSPSSGGFPKLRVPFWVYVGVPLFWETIVRVQGASQQGHPWRPWGCIGVIGALQGSFGILLIDRPFSRERTTLLSVLISHPQRKGVALYLIYVSARNDIGRLPARILSKRKSSPTDKNLWMLHTGEHLAALVLGLLGGIGCEPL